MERPLFTFTTKGQPPARIGGGGRIDHTGKGRLTYDQARGEEAQRAGHFPLDRLQHARVAMGSRMGERERGRE